MAAVHVRRHRHTGRRRPRASSGASAFLREHSLSLVVAGLVIALVLGYARADPSTHVGAFLGNAIADWLGLLAFVIATKYFFEVGSGESRQPTRHAHERVADFLLRHSLTVVLLLTVGVWAAVYAHSQVDGKYGQVAGNIVSNWTQLLGLVIITKYARERGSKEGS
jgi:hypothetical protein